MKSRPILFSAPMVRALLDGSKTQTRRICKNKIYSNGFHFDGHEILCHNDYLPPSATLMDVKRGGIQYTTSCHEGWEFESPYGQPGDRLWVRETWAIASKATDLVKVYYAASEKQSHTEFHKYFPVELANNMLPTWPKYRPSIHMPRWASRVTLEITGVRVERLQDISRNDAVAEGVDWKTCPTHQTMQSLNAQLAARKFGMSAHYEAEIDYIAGYHKLWESINGAGSWDANPWVWVIEFKVIEAKP